jgi:hypothetical protein
VRTPVLYEKIHSLVIFVLKFLGQGAQLGLGQKSEQKASLELAFCVF